MSTTVKISLLIVSFMFIGKCIENKNNELKLNKTALKCDSLTRVNNELVNSIRFNYKPVVVFKK